MTRLVVLAFLALTRSAWTISTNNRHVRPSVRVFPADYVGLMAQNRTAQTTRSPAMPFPRQSKPFALPHMSKSAKYPPPHPHSIKEMPRSKIKTAPSSPGKQISPNNPISKIINSHHELGGQSMTKSSSSSNGQSRSPNAQPYSFDDYYYYDYDYDYEPKAKKPKLVTKAAPPPKRKTSSNLYPTYKRPPSPPRPSYRRPISQTYRKRPSSPDTRIVKKSGHRSPSRADQNSRSRIGSATPTVQSSPSRFFEQTNSRSGDYYYDDYDYYYDDYEPSSARRRSESRSSGYGGGGTDLNPLALLVAPLAGISLLTAAAAVALNPVLVSISITGKKRRKRSLLGQDLPPSNSSKLDPEVIDKIHEMEVLEKFLVSVPSQVKYQQQILSMYLSCSGYLEETNLCLDRVFCEYADPRSSLQDDERDVVAIVLFNIMGNDLLGQDYKERLKHSAQAGREGKSCKMKYPCNELDTSAPTAIPNKLPKKTF